MWLTDLRKPKTQQIRTGSQFLIRHFDSNTLPSQTLYVLCLLNTIHIAIPRARAKTERIELADRRRTIILVITYMHALTMPTARKRYGGIGMHCVVKESCENVCRAKCAKYRIFWIRLSEEVMYLCPISMELSS